MSQKEFQERNPLDLNPLNIQQFNYLLVVRLKSRIKHMIAEALSLGFQLHVVRQYVENELEDVLLYLPPSERERVQAQKGEE